MANEKPLDLSTLQAGLKRYDDSLADVAKSGDYNDLVNKPESGIVENFETLKNDITRKGVSQWDLEITTGDSGNVTNENLTTWTIQLTQSMIDIINEKADGNGTLSGVMNYCAVRCVKNHDNQNIESIIKITRADTSISDLQVGDKIVFTIIGTWIDWDDFWTGVDEKYVGENVSAKITRSDSTLSGWTIGGSYFAQDRITAKKVTADTVGDKDGTLAELRESVSPIKGIRFGCSAVPIAAGSSSGTLDITFNTPLPDGTIVAIAQQQDWRTAYNDQCFVQVRNYSRNGIKIYVVQSTTETTAGSITVGWMAVSI